MSAGQPIGLLEKSLILRIMFQPYYILSAIFLQGNNLKFIKYILEVYRIHWHLFSFYYVNYKSLPHIYNIPLIFF